MIGITPGFGLRASARFGLPTTSIAKAPSTKVVPDFIVLLSIAAGSSGPEKFYGNILDRGKEQNLILLDRYQRVYLFNKIDAKIFSHHCEIIMS